MKNEIKVKGDGEDFCNYCGACIAYKKDTFFDVCPGMSVDFVYLSKKHLNKKNINSLIGNYFNIYLIRSNDEEIRSNSASGGAVSSILLDLIDKNQINKAILADLDGTKTVPRVVSNKKGVLECSQSKYSIVPMDVEIDKLNEKTAFVGLPCHVHGLRMFQDKTDKNPFITIGLFCGFNLRPEATNYLIKKLGVNLNDVKKIRYRDGEWPGSFSVYTEHFKKSIDKLSYNFLIPLFVLKRCLICPDLTNELADISVGDFWLEPGWSVVITRSAKGEKIIKSLKNVEIKKIGFESLYKSHEHLFNYKKRGVHVRMKYFNFKPKYNFIKIPKVTKDVENKERRFLKIILLSQNKLFSGIIKMLPLSILKSLSRIWRKKI